MKRYAVTIFVAVVVAVVVVVYLFFDPEHYSFFPRCPFLMLTGLKCPGCGSQRVIHSLLQGDLAAAWHYNAYMVAALPVIAMYSFAELTRTRLPRLYIRLNSPKAIWSIFAVTMLWWLLRNICGW